MQELLTKIKGVGLYFFAVLGALAVVVILVVLAYLLFSFSGEVYFGDFARAPSVGSTASYGEGLSSPFTAESKRSSSVTPQDVSKITEGELTKRKVIKTGSLSLLVKKAEEVAEQIRELAAGLGGFIADSKIYEVSANVKSGSVVIRVPADRFDEAMDGVKKLAVKVERENVSASDATEQFIDLEARLKNLRAEEAQYLEIMKRAYAVEDTLKVAERLSSVRGRIEQIQGQLQYLSRQIDMSTITVSLTAEADLEVFGLRWRPLFVAKQAFRNMLSGLTSYTDTLIRFIFRLPVILLWFATVFLILLGVWKFGRRIWLRFFINRPQ